MRSRPAARLRQVSPKAGDRGSKAGRDGGVRGTQQAARHWEASRPPLCLAVPAAKRPSPLDSRVDARAVSLHQRRSKPARFRKRSPCGLSVSTRRKGLSPKLPSPRLPEGLPSSASATYRLLYSLLFCKFQTPGPHSIPRSISKVSRRMGGLPRGFPFICSWPVSFPRLREMGGLLKIKTAQMLSGGI